MLDMSESWWTTEQVMEYLGVSRQAIYDSRARGKFPGNRGHRRSKRLLFPATEIEEGKRLVEAGEDPDPERETTNDPQVAILWTLQGIEAKLDTLIKMLRPLVTPQFILATTDEEEKNE